MWTSTEKFPDCFDFLRVKSVLPLCRCDYFISARQSGMRPFCKQSTANKSYFRARRRRAAAGVYTGFSTAQGIISVAHSRRTDMPRSSFCHDGALSPPRSSLNRFPAVSGAPCLPAYISSLCMTIVMRRFLCFTEKRGQPLGRDCIRKQTFPGARLLTARQMENNKNHTLSLSVMCDLF